MNLVFIDDYNTWEMMIVRKMDKVIVVFSISKQLAHFSNDSSSPNDST